MKYLKHLIGRLLCRMGLHAWGRKPIIADLDTYWMQGGKECIYCKTKRISFKEAEILIKSAYNRGKERVETKYLAQASRELTK